MNIKEIKQQLHDYIDGTDDKRVMAIYASLEGEIAEYQKLIKTQKTEPAKKNKEQQNNADRPLTWDENMALAKLAMQKRNNR